MSADPAPVVRHSRLLLHGVSWAEYSRCLRAFAERPRVRLTYDRGVLEIMTPGTASTSPKVSRIVLTQATWAEYSRCLRAFAERPRIRLTYDRGVLEIMSPLSEHERPTDMLGRFVIVLTEELGLPAVCGGAMTLRRRGRRRGLEPDRCWWIANASRLRSGLHIDLRTDPPPDLAIEVDVTSSSLDRMRIYASLGVPELWRVDEGLLTFHVLDTAARAYRIQANSLAFPILASADVNGFLGQLGQVDDTTLGLRFRAWLRQRLAAPPQP